MEENKEINNPLENLGSQVKNIIPDIKLRTETDDPIVNKLKKWALIILSCLVGGGALILIVKSIIGKVF